MADNTVRGRFVWHELMTPNPAGAHEFYSNVVGWKRQAWGKDPSYSMFAASSGPLGASVELRDGTPQWVPYIGTTDVDATVAVATRLGGSVTIPPTSVPNAGRYAVLTDPHGATFGVHGSAADPRPEAPAQYGQFHWHELATTAGPQEAFGFYAELFDWDEIAQHDMGPIGTYLIFGRNGTQLGGMFNKGEMGKPGAAYWVGYVRVKNLDDTVAKVKSARGSLLNGPMDVPGGDRIAQFSDPHGAFFAAHMAAADVKAAPKETNAPQRPESKTAGGSPRKTAEKRGKTKIAKKKVAKKLGKKAAKKVAKKKSARKKKRSPAKKSSPKARKRRSKGRR